MVYPVSFGLSPKVAVGVMFGVALILAWHAIALQRPNYIPLPGAVASSISVEWTSGRLVLDMQATTRRVLTGCFLGATVGLIVAIVTTWHWSLNASLGALLNPLRAVPLVAITPLLVAVAGIGEVGKVVAVTLGAFFPVWTTAHDGIVLIQKRFEDLERTLALSRTTRIFFVRAPALLPHLFSGFRLAVSQAFVLAFIAEWLGSNDGLGYRIGVAHTVGRLDAMIGGIVVLAALAATADRLTLLLRRTFDWSRYDA